MDAIIAHVNQLGQTQTLQDHLNGVADLAQEYAVDKFKDIARCAGLNHDIGKCRPDFQKRIRGMNNIHCEHACCAAQEIMRISSKSPASYLLAYCMAGHHTGLQDGGSRVDSPEDTTLSAALRRNVKDYLPLGSHYSVPTPNPTDFTKLLTENTSDTKEVIEKFAFFTRYVYSCLVDADFLDTERFCSPGKERETKSDFQAALELLNSKLNSFPADTEVRKARKLLQEQASQNNDGSEISFMNMPTGAGKTLCSMKLALEDVLKYNKKRIIYVIPYTSVIEQTAQTFEEIFGNTLPVLQHHSNYNIDSSEKEATDIQKEALASENWDAPLIITTNVQFFQSLYHYKSDRLRKMHNLSDAVIIFDEIHMMPVKYLQPCLRAVGYITHYLNSRAMFLSATMPDFSELLQRYADNCKCNTLIKDESLFNAFKNQNYEYIGSCSAAKLISLTASHRSNLIIVNNRKYARELYTLCSDFENVYHLSTYMTAVDRSATIKEIKEKLTNNEKIIVISTSLIEIGIDLDFETVYREIAGLDNIMQSGGRCNREGKRSTGTVYIFEREEGINNSLSVQANLSKSLFFEYGDITNLSAITEYYKRLYLANDDIIKANTIAHRTSDITSIRFRTYSESFNLIENDTIGVVIPCEENKTLLEQLKFGGMSCRRKLQKYTASLHWYELKSMIEEGVVNDYGTGVYQLTDLRYYNNKTGLNPKYVPDDIY